MFARINLRIGFLLLALALFFAIVMVPTVSEEWRQASTSDVQFFTVGPRFFPYLSAGIMGFLSIMLILESWLRIRSGLAKSRWVFPTERLKPVITSICIGIAYIAVLSPLGVIPATPLCLVVYFWYFGLRRWKWIIILPIGITAIIYICFEKLMMVPLPMGLLEY